MDLYIISLVFGYLAIPCAFFAFQAKTMRWTFHLNASAASLMGMHFLLIGANTGGIIAIAGALTLIIQTFLPSKSPLRLRLAIGIPSIILAILFREPGWFSFLPLTAFALGRFSEALYDPNLTRIGLAASFCLWLIYGALSGSIQAVIYEAIAIFSIALSFWKRKAKAACRDHTRRRKLSGKRT